MDYCGNVGERVMKEVDHALAHSLGMKHSENGNLELESLEPVQIAQNAPVSAYRFCKNK